MKKILHQIGQFFRGKKRTTVPFKVLFADFKKSLELNNEILELIADANDKLSGDYIFDEQFVHTITGKLTRRVRELIVIINHLTEQKYTDLFVSFHQIEEDLTAILKGRMLFPVRRFVLPYADVKREHLDGVGGKNAHIAEIGSLLDIDIPPGFAITTAGFAAFWEVNGLEEIVLDHKEQWQNKQITVDEAANNIQSAILQGILPKQLEQEIISNAVDIIETHGEEDVPLFFAVRSSALGEDDVASFAGQYRSCLNIPLDGIPQAYLEVLASLYSPEVLAYRMHKDFRSEEIMMAVACQVMVPAQASGVLYTYDPLHPEMETMLINSAWGLGEPIVAGEIPTDSFVMSRKEGHEVTEMQIVRKDQLLVSAESEGTNVQPVREDQRTAPSLRNRHLHKLAILGLQLEKYFKKPQDVEFAIDPHDRIVVLQSRQLQLQDVGVARSCELSGLNDKYPILMRGVGVAAMEGVAVGPVWVMGRDGDLQDFPTGAILVARRASPQIARVVHKAAGFITDIGSTTGHLATVAREFRVPALFNLGNATTKLTHGTEITLDTECLTIYEGVVQELHYHSLREEPIEEMYEYRLLRRILKRIEPLNLFDPNGENFTPMGCETYHDLTRFVHEKAVETIIDISFYHAHHRDTKAGQLICEYPLDLILIDVGGGIDGEHENGILPEQIRSVPMLELLRGMSTPGVWDMSPAKVDLGSFMSSLTRTSANQHTRPEDVGRNLAVVSAEYTSINFRLGYHFTVIDSYISDCVLDNHIYFRFSGGVTSTTRRLRRTRLLAEILTYYDFLCELQDDIVVARLKRMDKESMLKRLFLLGLLVGFTRQLDVKMVSDTKIQEYFEEIKNIMEEHDEK